MTKDIIERPAEENQVKEKYLPIIEVVFAWLENQKKSLDEIDTIKTADAKLLDYLSAHFPGAFY